MASPTSDPLRARVLDRTPVAPPAGELTGTSLPLTLFDVNWLYTGPVERLFFYTSGDPAALRCSLPLALSRFRPLAGRVRQVPGSGTGFEIHCEQGDSVAFTVAESDDDFDCLSGDQLRDSARLGALVPSLPPISEDGSMRLLAVQVTIFPHGGIVIGVSIHHVACDDSSSIQFMKTWAAACRLGSTKLEPPPFFDRTVISDPRGLYSKILNDMQSFKPTGPPPSPPSNDLVFASFTLELDQIKQLKQKVNPQIHCSTFVVACGLAWVCLVRAQGRHAAAANGIAGNGRSSIGGKREHLLFSVDCRRRLQPPVPEEYFGNCLRPCFVETDVSGLPAAAEAIGRAIGGMGEGGVLDGAEGWFEKVMSVLPEGPMSVAGSPKFKVYDVDFGWGRPRKVEMPSILKTPGTVSLAEGRAGEGGVEIGVALPEHQMDQFVSSFTKGLQLG